MPACVLNRYVSGSSGITLYQSHLAAWPSLITLYNLTHLRLSPAMPPQPKQTSVINPGVRRSEVTTNSTDGPSPVQKLGASPSVHCQPSVAAAPPPHRHHRRHRRPTDLRPVTQRVFGRRSSPSTSPKLVNDEPVLLPAQLGLAQ